MRLEVEEELLPRLQRKLDLKALGGAEILMGLVRPGDRPAAAAVAANFASVRSLPQHAAGALSTDGGSADPLSAHARA